MALYIKSVMVASVLCSITVLLSPKNHSPSGKALSVLSAFVMVFVILSPIKSAVENITSLSDKIRIFFATETADYTSALPSYGADELSVRLKILISEEFDIDTEYIHTKITFDMTDETSPKIASSEIEISCEVNTTEEKIAKFVCEITDAPCAVTVT